MRVVVANKFWYGRGGLERVMFDEIGMLERAGHHVAHFSTRHPDNVASPWQEHFVEYLELGGGRLAPSRSALAACRMFVNREAARKFAGLLAEFRPDVVHVHGVHRHLSPSILFEASARRIPVVQTVHDYHHICPNGELLVKTAVCEPRRCGRIWLGPCVRHACVKGSVGKSVLAAAETAFQSVRRAYERTISRFVYPSRFIEGRMAEAGWDVPHDVLPNAVALGAESGRDGGVVYAGRLAPGKGVDVLLEAANGLDCPVAVAGEGPEESRLRGLATRARFVARLNAVETGALMSNATVVVVPSTYPENAPLSLLEAMALGKPVVASAVGGIPEIVTDGVDGLLVPPGDAAALSAALRCVIEDRGLADALGRDARRKVRDRFDPERHYRGLIEVYGKAVESCA